MFLLCDPADLPPLQVVFLPFSASGRFYTTAHKTSKNPNHVYLMAHILKNHKLPLTVRLVCGYMPRVPCNFTGESGRRLCVCAGNPLLLLLWRGMERGSLLCGY